MKTLKFEQRISSILLPLSAQWELDVRDLVPLVEYRKKVVHEMRQGKMYRKIVTARIMLSDCWIGLELCQDRDHLDFIYIGVTPDENSPQCLDLEYHKALMWQTLAAK